MSTIDTGAPAAAVTLAGPDDPAPGVDQDALVALLRDIFHAAGGHHPNLDWGASAVQVSSP